MPSDITFFDLVFQYCSKFYQLLCSCKAVKILVGSYSFTERVPESVVLVKKTQ